MKKRTLVIGDIHGYPDKLKEVLELSKYNQKFDSLIFIGDLVDRGPDSPGVIEYCIQLQNEAIDNPIIFIKGNHDEFLLSDLKGVNRDLKINFDEDAFSHYENKKYLIPKHLEFLENMVNFHIDDKNRGFVHGGFTSKQGLGYEMHNSVYYWDRDLWNLAVMQHTATIDASEVILKQSTRFLRHTEVFIGHTTTMQWIAKGHFPESKDPNQILNGKITIPMNRCNVWNVDTGCGYPGGKLTIMDIDTKEYWQSSKI